MRIYFGGENHGAPQARATADCHQADGTSAGDDHILRSDFSGQHRVHGVAERIENRGVVFGNRGIDFPDIADGDDYELSEAAVGIYADDFHILADDAAGPCGRGGNGRNSRAFRR